MRRLLSGWLLSLSLLAGAAHAETVKFYFGAGVSDGTVDIAGDNEKSLGTVSVSAGVQLRDLIGLELNLGSASDQTGSIISEPQVSYYALMLRLGYRWDRVGVYLLGGMAQMDIDESFNDSEDGNVFGVAVNLFGNDTTALHLRVLDFDDGAFQTTTVGFQHYFGGFR